MELAGVDRRLFASTGGNLHRASWNPIRLTYHGTVEIRSMDANFPEVILAVCALICGAVDRLRRERLRVRPRRQVRTIELDGDELLVPHFSYLSGELLEAAVTYGVLDQRIDAYLDSFVRFARTYVEEPDLVESLGYPYGGYKTTEVEVLRSFPHFEASLDREQGLRLVQLSCRQLREQVFAFRRMRHGARHDGEHATNARGWATPHEVARTRSVVDHVDGKGDH